MGSYIYFSMDDSACDFLSNWYESDMVVDGIRFICMWQYILYQRAVLYGDYELCRLIRFVKGIDELKELNRKIIWYESKEWVDRRYNIVKRGIIAKFSSNDELLRKFLVFPKYGVFVNCNPYDRVWGCGMSILDKDVKDESNWRGLNLLGKILTEVRIEIDDCI